MTWVLSAALLAVLLHAVPDALRRHGPAVARARWHAAMAVAMLVVLAASPPPLVAALAAVAFGVGSLRAVTGPSSHGVAGQGADVRPPWTHGLRRRWPDLRLALGCAVTAVMLWPVTRAAALSPLPNDLHLHGPGAMAGPARPAATPAAGAPHDHLAHVPGWLLALLVAATLGVAGWALWVVLADRGRERRLAAAAELVMALACVAMLGAALVA